MTGSLFLLVVGLVLLVAGGELLVRGASKLASIFGVSPLVIGLTVVAYGTSAPELGVSLLAGLRGNADIAIANVVGSNILNIALILGFCSLIAPLVVNLQLIKLDVPFLIVVSLVTWFFLSDGQLSQTEGLILFTTALLYTTWLVWASRKESRAMASSQNEPVSVDKNRTRSLLIQLALVMVGLVLLVFGADYLVQGATILAKSLGVSDAVIGLTIVAAGTSLPELAASTMATLRGETDMAIGNIIGSNIFNLLLILGVSASISSDGLKVAESILRFDILVMVAVAVVCFPMLVTGKKLVRWEGAVLFSSYLLYSYMLWT